MRHLWSFLAGVVAAPLIWVLIALGQSGSARTITGWVEVGTFNTANLIESAVYLGVAGILLGLVGMLRTSPLGPFVAGLLLAAPYAGMFAAPFTVRDAVPGNWKLFGDPLHLRLPLENGTLFLIGVMLLVAVFSRQRWRTWPAPAGPTTPATTGDGRGGDDDPTLTDWSSFSSKSSDSEADTTPMSLGYPAGPPTPLPQRREGGSPWSAPPRASTTREDTLNG